MQTDRYYKTANFNLSTFLYTQDQIIAGINPTKGSQKEFTFTLSPMLEELIDVYKFGNKEDERLLVPVHKYESARRYLLDRLND